MDGKIRIVGVLISWIFCFTAIGQNVEKKDSDTVIRFDDTGNINWYKTPGLNIETRPSDRLHLNAEASEKLIEPVV